MKSTTLLGGWWLEAGTIKRSVRNHYERLKNQQRTTTKMFLNEK